MREISDEWEEGDGIILPVEDTEEFDLREVKKPAKQKVNLLASVF